MLVGKETMFEVARTVNQVLITDIVELIRLLNFPGTIIFLVRNT